MSRYQSGAGPNRFVSKGNIGLLSKLDNQKIVTPAGSKNRQIRNFADFQAKNFFSVKNTDPKKRYSVFKQD